MNVLVPLGILIIVLILFTKSEAFSTSPGTFVQLSSNRPYYGGYYRPNFYRPNFYRDHRGFGRRRGRGRRFRRRRPYYGYPY